MLEIEVFKYMSQVKAHDSIKRTGYVTPCLDTVIGLANPGIL